MTPPGAPPPGVHVRTARPADYDRIAPVVDAWWGRPVLPLLPRLFLSLFWSTSLVAERDGELAGFLVGLDSPSDAVTSYVHFLGVSPAERGMGLGHLLHTRFADRATAAGRRRVQAVTSPANEPSIAFHRTIGFTVAGPVADHNGPGTSYILFERPLIPPS